MTVHRAAATLQRALALHQRGDAAAAMPLYREVLAEQPRNVDALHLLGVAQRQCGDPASAAETIGAALAIDPGHAIAHSNLGAALQDLGRTQEALASYEKALALKPDYAMAHANRANALRRLGRLDEALDSYDRALHLNPSSPEAWSNRGLALNALGRFEAALDSFGRALGLRPRFADAWCGQGAALQGAGLMEAAAGSYESALQCDPGHAEALVNMAALMQRLHRHEEALSFAEQAVARHRSHPGAQLRRANALNALGRGSEAADAYRAARDCGADRELCSYMLAALGSEPAPASAPSGYVQALFDQYAGHFDEHLEQVLQYQTPRALTAALSPYLHRKVDIVDVGCGTGLCGPLLRPLAATLTGVDLSPNMIGAARRTQAYDRLEYAELCGFLQHEARAFDVVTAADVLVYVGDLDPVFAAGATALRDDGLFAFSVEAGTGTGHVLQTSGRYAHGEAYVRAAAARHGFDMLELSRHTLRRDRAGDIEGYLCIMRLERRP